MKWEIPYRYLYRYKGEQPKNKILKNTFKIVSGSCINSDVPVKAVRVSGKDWELVSSSFLAVVPQEALV